MCEECGLHVIDGGIFLPGEVFGGVHALALLPWRLRRHGVRHPVAGGHAPVIALVEEVILPVPLRDEGRGDRGDALEQRLPIIDQLVNGTGRHVDCHTRLERQFFGVNAYATAPLHAVEDFFLGLVGVRVAAESGIDRAGAHPQVPAAHGPGGDQVADGALIGWPHAVARNILFSHVLQGVLPSPLSYGVSTRGRRSFIRLGGIFQHGHRSNGRAAAVADLERKADEAKALAVDVAEQSPRFSIFSRCIMRQTWCAGSQRPAEVVTGRVLADVDHAGAVNISAASRPRPEYAVR